MAAPQQSTPTWAKRLEEGQRDTLMLLARAAATLERIVLATRDLEVTMSDQSNQLAASVSDLSDKVGSIGAAIDTEIQQLADSVAAGQDVTAQIDNIKNLTATLQGGVDKLAADDTAPPA